jgi:hypothetical protein
MFIKKDVIAFAQKGLNDPKNRYQVIINGTNWININNVNEEFLLRIDQEDFQKVKTILETEQESHVQHIIKDYLLEQKNTLPDSYVQGIIKKSLSKYNDKLHELNITDMKCNRCDKVYKAIEFLQSNSNDSYLFNLGEFCNKCTFFTDETDEE